MQEQGLPEEPCTRGVLWVCSAVCGRRVGLDLKGNKVGEPLQQQQDGVMGYLHEIPLLLLFSLQCHACLTCVKMVLTNAFFTPRIKCRFVLSGFLPVPTGRITFTDCLSNTPFLLCTRYNGKPVSPKGNGDAMSFVWSA